MSDGGKPFDGVRSVLLGFDDDTESETRLKLVKGGGEVFGRYRKECTHMIVDKCVYDDPACVAARNDGKIVVTALWVKHSYDVNMPVDHTNVMYRPLKDLKGIPEAKDLVICLTGYQRQDREDIMIMVNLMGAEFSKSLVASRATHLICYKFEGEKYELAKKLPKIKIVNHAWLEDCLSSWELLPEDNYAKSGYALEMEAEAEAKDSEDEEITEGSIKKQNIGKNINMSYHTRLQTGAFSTLPSIQAVSNIPVAPVSSVVSSTEGCKVSTGDNEGTLAPEECNNNVDLVIDGSSNINVVKYESSNQSLEFRDAKQGPESICPEIFEESDLAPTPCKEKKKALNDLSYSFGSAKKFLDPGSKNSYELTYARKTSPGSSFRDLIDATGDSDEQVGEPQGPNALECLSNTERKKESGGTKTVMETSNPGKEALDNVLPAKRKNHDNAKTPKKSRALRNPVVCNDGIDVTPPGSGTITINRHSPGSNGDIPVAHNLVNPSEKITAQKEKHDIVMLPTELMPANSENLRNKCLTTGDKQKSHSKLKKNATKGKSPGKKILGSILNAEAPSHSTDLRKSKEPDSSVDGNTKHKAKPLDKKISSSNLDSEVPSHSANFGKDGGSKHKATCLGKNISGDGVDAKVKSVAKALNKKSSCTVTKISCAEALNAEENRDTHDAINTENLSSANDALQMEKVDGEAKYKAMTAEEVIKDKDMESLLHQGEKTDQRLSFSKVGDNSVNGKNKCPQENEKEALKRNSKRGKTNKTTQRHIKSGKKSTAAPSIKKMGHDSSEAEMVAAGNKGQPEFGSKDDEKSLLPLNNNGQKCTLPANKRKSTLESEKKNRPLPEDAEDGDMDGKILHPPNNSARKKADDANKLKNVPEAENENVHQPDESEDTSFTKAHALSTVTGSKKTPSSGKRKASVIRTYSTDKVIGNNFSKNEVKFFLLSGHRYQRKEFSKIIRQLNGRVCRDSHHWSYQATHLIVPEPLRTEKFFAAAASGRWILKPDYLTESLKAGKFLEEEPYEWHSNEPGQVGRVDLVAPRKWRLLRQQTVHGAFYGMRIIVYGDFFSPPLDTLKRVVKAGDGVILATAPPFTRFLNSGVDFAVISQGMAKVDVWVQEFLKNKIPCVLIDYLVEFVCNPSSPLQKHVMFDTESWAEKSYTNLVRRSVEIAQDLTGIEE